MRKLLAVILFIASSTTVALSQSNSYTSPSTTQSVIEQNHVSLSAVPVSDSLLDAQRKADGNSFRRMAGEKPSPSNAEPVNPGDNETEGRFWFSAESLIWKMKDANLPPLITTATAPGTDPFMRGGIIGGPTTVIAFGGKLDKGTFVGGRFAAGAWLNQKKNVGVELSYFFLPRRTYSAQASGSGLQGSIFVSRPFFDITTGQEAASVISRPMPPTSPLFVSPGSSTGALSSRLQGGEANFIYRFDPTGCCRFSLTGGFRYLDLEERLNVTDVFLSVFDFGTGPSVVDMDAFFTRNRFYGGQIGARSLFDWGRANLEVSGSLGLGVTRQLVNINGSTLSNSAGAVEARVGAILAQRSNIGSYRRSEFTVVTELKVSFGYDLTRFFRPFVSYDFLYWNKVAMTGEQIDRGLDPLFLFGRTSTIVPAPTRPAFTFRDTGYWTHGLTTGVKLRF